MKKGREEKHIRPDSGPEKSMTSLLDGPPPPTPGPHGVGGVNLVEPEVLNTARSLATSSSESFPSRNDRWNEPPPPPPGERKCYKKTRFEKKAKNYRVRQNFSPLLRKILLH